MSHWHIAYGLFGYGPDGADGFATFDTPESVAEALHSTYVPEVVEQLDDEARMHALDEDYKAAWEAHVYGDEVNIVRQNFNPARANAPLYADEPEKWRSTIIDLIGQHFPLQVVHSTPGGTHLYVWECEEPDCDHLEEE